MTESEFLDLLRQLESDLYSGKFNPWVERQSEEDKKKIRDLRTVVCTRRSQLETNRLKVLADQLDEFSAQLQEGMKALQRTIGEMDSFAACVEVLGHVVALISRITRVREAANL